MALPFAFLVNLVMLLCSSTFSLACTLPQTHSQGNMRALILLGQRRRITALSCLKHRQDFGLAGLEFEGKQVQKAQALSVLHEMITQTLNLFTSQYSGAAWNQSLLDSFCAGLYEQLNDLEACLTQETGLEEPLLIHEDSRLAVRKYFNRITVYLKEKSYSPCAWEVVRAEIWRSFSFSATLQGRVQRKQ